MPAELSVERLELPDPLHCRAVARTERQHWQRLGRAEGELVLGYDERGVPVRIEYHWVRFLSRSDGGQDDVYTAELWARRHEGDWLYLLRPKEAHFITVNHEQVRPLLLAHLDVDVGD